MPQNPRQQSVVIKVHCIYQHAGLVNCFEVKNPFFVFRFVFEYLYSSQNLNIRGCWPSQMATLVGPIHFLSGYSYIWLLLMMCIYCLVA